MNKFDSVNETLLNLAILNTAWRDPQSHEMRDPFSLYSYTDSMRESIEQGRQIAKQFGENSPEVVRFVKQAREQWLSVDLRSNHDYMASLFLDFLNMQSQGGRVFDGAGFAADQMHHAAGLIGGERVWLDLCDDTEASDFDTTMQIEFKVVEFAALLDMAAYAPRVFCMIYNGVGDYDYSKFTKTFAEFRKELRHLAACYLNHMDRLTNARHSSLSYCAVAGDMNCNMYEAAKHELHFIMHETNESHYLGMLVALVDMNYERIIQGAQPF